MGGDGYWDRSVRLGGIHYVSRGIHLPSRLLRTIRLVCSRGAKSPPKPRWNGIPTIHDTDVREANIQVGGHAFRQYRAAHDADTVRSLLLGTSN